MATGIEIVSVQPQNAPAMTLSYQSGRVVDPGTPNTIADGVAGRYVIPEVLDDLLAVAIDALLVYEESIKDGMAPSLLALGADRGACRRPRHRSSSRASGAICR
jgi:threonine dehydratase